MNIEGVIFAWILFCAFLTMVLFILFGQITVRKLRKNPKTKEDLGIEFASGWDIINVAQALALPSSWLKRIENSPLAFMEANSRVIRENTNKFDHILGAIFYWLLMTTGLAAPLLALASSIGFFE